LTSAGVLVTRAACYRTRPRPDEARALAAEIASGAVDLLVLGSPSAVNALAQALREAELAADRVPAALCFGSFTAQAARVAGWPRVEISE
jgi:uroporphyrinogen-III synthase